MVMAVFELDLDSDTPEERRVRTEEEPVDAGLEVGGEFGDTAVGVGFTRGEEIVAPELDADAARGTAALDVEDMSGQRDAHGPTFGL